ncbi:MAG TPA: HAD family phosphatase [Candidatus Saccharimonadia bacterium]|nr:HAD family phosphatase [Candidatus Saccharimonadia bacterium]
MNNLHLPTSGFKAAIFDMDGTMIDNMAYHQRAWQEFFKRHHITLTEAEFKHRVSGKKNDQIFESVFGETLDAARVQAFTEEKEALYRQLYAPHITEVAGLGRIIAELHDRGIWTAIATTAPAKNREFALKALGLEGEFEVILGDEHVRRGKPDPEIYLATAAALGVEPSACIAFEDSPPGVQSAQAAGMMVVGILTSHAAAELVGAASVVRDYDQIELA